MAIIKEKTKIPEQKPEIRKTNFNEVALGYTEELALIEASRCLNCPKPKCVEGCPVEIDIPAFINLIKEKKYIEANQKIKEKNSLPAICGRVCPQEDQCEIKCILGINFEPVGIGRLERFVADYELAQDSMEIPELPPKTGKRVAIIGSGPAGLTAAGELIKQGHDVVVFEALHKCGGVLVYGIPEFRLPKDVVQKEIDYIAQLGVEFRTSKIIGKTLLIDDLKEEFDTIFLGNGAGLPYFMGIPGENLNGVYSANEFLTRANLMKAYLFPEFDTPIKYGEKVAVVGGGNVAMDSARTALRLGAGKVFIVYRRSRTELPAREEEIHHAEEEGINFNLLTNPVEIIGDEDGWVKEIKAIRMKLGEPDSSGRRRPIPIEGSEFTFKVNTVIMAIGQGANPLIAATAPDIETNKWGYFIVDDETQMTNVPGIFAGGDIVTGAATVILAAGAGKKAAKAMHEYLMKKD
ncbi:NADPH-dependent glutamate synthase [Candidatus Dependentiae bacterium]|nr:NADPH-dependent glutamate synthase [Candidatus Dependentiae bacterium]